MSFKRWPSIRSSEITPESQYANRREFLKQAGVAGAGLAAVAAGGVVLWPRDGGAAQQKDEPTPFEDVTTYNNFYEFGTGKGDPSRTARNFKTKPWTVKIDGLCNKPGDYQLEDFLAPSKIENRVYRMRCVEAWSMVIPWNGIPLSDVIKRAEPTASAQFVEFTTLLDPRQMPGQRMPVLDWPYVEGLRLDEARHPLTLLATGLYDQTLLPQNGAPLRLVTPWKYGFKGIKSIVRIRFTDRMPLTSWSKSAPDEYGFYANVNPAVDHPRWSQARERRVGEFRMRDTLPFNGYADQVASLYSGLDLKRWY
jgi:methionine sulfoxide reductase catalytic subunit